jgi:hypothetical protein
MTRTVFPRQLHSHLTVLPPKECNSQLVATSRHNNNLCSNLLSTFPLLWTEALRSKEQLPGAL